MASKSPPAVGLPCLAMRTKGPPSINLLPLVRFHNQFERNTKMKPETIEVL